LGGLIDDLMDLMEFEDLDTYSIGLLESDGEVEK
jgi:hypothetical protein